MHAANISLRVNRACKYYPCHKALEDCAFCYCPFYPCLDPNRGSCVYSKNKNKKIWSCMDCSWIHKKRVVDRIFAMIRANRNFFSPQSPAGKMKTGIIILGHGSKLKSASRVMRDISAAVRRKQAAVVEPAYLQFHQPDIALTIRKLVNKGCKKIIIVPFFLLEGNHVTRDIPKAIRAEKQKYPDVDFVYARNLGDDPRIEGIVLDRIREALLKCR